MNNKGADGTEQMCRLVYAFVVHKYPKICFLASQPIWFWYSKDKLTLSSLVTTFVICTPRLLIFLNSTYCKQYGPRSDWSGLILLLPWKTLVWSQCAWIFAAVLVNTGNILVRKNSGGIRVKADNKTLFNLPQKRPLDNISLFLHCYSPSSLQ